MSANIIVADSSDEDDILSDDQDEVDSTLPNKENLIIPNTNSNNNNKVVRKFASDSGRKIGQKSGRQPMLVNTLIPNSPDLPNYIDSSLKEAATNKERTLESDATFDEDGGDNDEDSFFSCPGSVAVSRKKTETTKSKAVNARKQKFSSSLSSEKEDDDKDDDEEKGSISFEINEKPKSKAKKILNTSSEKETGI